MRLIETGFGMTQAIVLLVLLYFLPAIIAWLYRRERVYSIFLLNLLMGWTVFGWFGALKWATIRDTRALEDIAPYPRYRARNRLIAATSIVALCLMIQAVRVYAPDYSRVHAAADNQGTMASAKRLIIDPNSVSLTRYVLRKDSVNLTGDLTIRNGNTFKVKDVVVKCVHATIDANVLDSTTTTIHRTLDSNSDQRISNIDLGSIPSRTANSTCSTAGFSLVE